jgi:hypothetical protein
MPSLITNDVLESYVRCALKGYLKLAGESGTRSTYEELVSDMRRETRLRAIARMEGRANNDQCASLSTKALKAGAEFVS